MVYVFMAFRSLHRGPNIGCCIVQVARALDANAKCKELGLMPEEGNECRGYVLDEARFRDQGMELDRLYNRTEMDRMGFGRNSFLSPR